eukprot:CAMPEP_0119299132 /NCGR_PEP_ID=MMETSP1333-20130426/1246_1 /TAXON_ID=418940 /ORGANISM="Scyphosphaera apsteinii, Strain RCC1455" /LENGTH=354 /DNA_ID=CAMNT_0007300459 /DNA_START=89 /DNA_END=1153 /DNA_ORIENTATION=+
MASVLLPLASTVPVASPHDSHADPTLEHARGQEERADARTTLFASEGSLPELGADLSATLLPSLSGDLSANLPSIISSAFRPDSPTPTAVAQLLQNRCGMLKWVGITSREHPDEAGISEVSKPGDFIYICGLIEGSGVSTSKFADSCPSTGCGFTAKCLSTRTAELQERAYGAGASEGHVHFATHGLAMTQIDNHGRWDGVLVDYDDTTFYHISASSGLDQMPVVGAEAGAHAGGIANALVKAGYFEYIPHADALKHLQTGKYHHHKSGHETDSFTCANFEKLYHDNWMTNHATSYWTTNHAEKTSRRMQGGVDGRVLDDERVSIDTKHAEMSGRIARLEKEVAMLKEKITMSA